MNYRFKRVFVIVMDSVGAGEVPDSILFGDQGANTLVHTAQSAGGLNVPYLNSLGLGDIGPIKGTSKVNHPQSYALAAQEVSNGKDTMTGHWEMMGLLTTKPFKTFTDNGFPKELIAELEEKTGYKIIGNIAASGTDIIRDLGEQQMKGNSLIVYTSADSVLQIAAHEGVTGLAELYRACDIAREICLRPEYLLGRIIARPFLGTNRTNFKRTPNRHDLALSPSGPTVLDLLKDNGLMTSCIGKIGDIFNAQGVVKTQKTISNLDGMQKTIQEASEKDFTGMCFVNLVEFDSEYGHRRDPLGYAKALEQFDSKLGTLLSVLGKEDLLILTADHGNDPTFRGTDHTRERVPVILFNSTFKLGTSLQDRKSFADIGATVLENFHINKPAHQIGISFLEDLK